MNTVIYLHAHTHFFLSHFPYSILEAVWMGGGGGLFTLYMINFICTLYKYIPVRGNPDPNEQGLAEYKPSA